MSENTVVKVSEGTNLGKIEIAPEVIEVIAGIATTEVDGVFAMRGNFASGVAERFGKKTHGKGIKVELTETGVIIDVFLTIDYGASVPVLAQKIQTNIRQALRNMTELDIEETNVHIVGVQIDSNEETQPEAD